MIEKIGLRGSARIASLWQGAHLVPEVTITAKGMAHSRANTERSREGLRSQDRCDVGEAIYRRASHGEG